MFTTGARVGVADGTAAVSGAVGGVLALFLGGC